MQTPTLHTERLVLRPVALSDAAALQGHFAHWEIIRFLSVAVPWPYPDDGVTSFLRDDLLPRVASGRAHAWALVPRAGQDEAIGLLEWRCDPTSTDHRGFWISQDWQGQGLMTEAVAAFQDWVFGVVGIEELVVHSAVTNAASRKVKEKTGARIVATVELAHHEGVTATYRWVLRREDWLAR